uniref:HNH endonuclease signature motif containing protein n=1 Tax=Arthrobacter sp. Br18 TaxID=1312954 RepID=UPI00068890D8
ATSLTVTEIACTLSLSERTAGALLRRSHALCRDFPDTLVALRRGRIFYHHATEIIEQSEGVPVSGRAGYERCLLAAAPGRTRAQLARLGRRERERHHPEAIPVRQAKAAADRRLELIPDRDGMCWLSAYLRAETASGVFAMVTDLARSVQGSDEARTLTQLRADVLVDLLTSPDLNTNTNPDPRTEPNTDPDTGSHAGTTGAVMGGRTGGGSGGMYGGSGGSGGSGGMYGGSGGSGGTGDRWHAGRGRIGAEVLLTMDVPTLLGLAERPAQLEGYGPLSPASARELAAISKHFTPLLVGGDSNALAMGRTARLPSKLLRRWLRFQDETCRFPGCSRGAAHCEVDHSVPWSHGGTTDHDNLAHLCAKHHRFKSITSWNLTDNTAGVLSWTSPTHRAYTTTPANPLTRRPTTPSPGNSLRHPMAASVENAAQGRAQEPTQDPAQGPTQDPVQDPTKAPTADPAPF